MLPRSRNRDRQGWHGGAAASCRSEPADTHAPVAAGIGPAAIGAPSHRLWDAWVASPNSGFGPYRVVFSSNSRTSACFLGERKVGG